MRLNYSMAAAVMNALKNRYPIKMSYRKPQLYLIGKLNIIQAQQVINLKPGDMVTTIK